MQFSVLISVYLHEIPDYFRQALESIVNQSLMPDEIVLMVDGPITAELEEVIQHHQFRYPQLLKVFRIPENVGLGMALRLGVTSCKYDLIARMDTDDIALPERFEKQVNFFRNNTHYAIVGTNVEEFDKMPGDLKIYKVLPTHGEALVAYAKYRNPLNHPTIMFRKQAVLNSGNYSGEIRLFEDYILYIRMLSSGYQFYNLQENLVYFRIGNGLANIKRRSGFQYLQNEIRFLWYARQLKYLNNWEYLKALFSKPLIRLLPAPLLIKFYKKFLRKSS